MRVRREASAEHAPDAAVLAVLARAVSPSSRAEALERASTLTAGLRSALEVAAGVRRVVLSRVSVHERHAWDPDTGRHRRDGWEASVSGSVRVDAGAADAVAEVAAGAGAEISGVGWVLDDPASARRAVRRAAVDAAREAAEDLADAVRRPLGALVELADAGLSSATAGGPELVMAKARGSLGGEPELHLDPQDVTVHAVVEATYALD
ncbi:SIMPL domain-containing protein [Geodermatophilus sp. SYSU D01119]